MMEIKILNRQGKSLRQIAREVGVSVNTVRKYKQYEGEPCYRARPVRITKLDAYKNYLTKRISDAKPLGLPATVLHREIVAQGYRGGITQLRAYIRTLKDVQPVTPVVRFETKPGEQMQVDWVEFRKNPFLAAFVATLGYSRTSYVQFVTDERCETLIECHKHAFDYFGGVPQHVLYDNMKTVIIKRDAYGMGKHKFHAAMLDFAHHYGFQLKVCKPYRACTKGKVERFNGYLRRSFYNPLVSRIKGNGGVLDKMTANAEVLQWLREIANVRIHGTTQQKPLILLQQEHVFLQPLPAPYTGTMSSLKAEQPLPFNATPVQHPLAVYQQLLEGCHAT
jgi:transposase